MIVMSVELPLPNPLMIGTMNTRRLQAAVPGAGGQAPPPDPHGLQSGLSVYWVPPGVAVGTTVAVPGVEVGTEVEVAITGVEVAAGVLVRVGVRVAVAVSVGLGVWVGCVNDGASCRDGNVPPAPSNAEATTS